MARFNDVAYLVSTKIEFDSVGAAHGVTEERMVYANAFSVSTDAALAARAQGLRIYAVLQVRTCDYRGEAQCRYQGELLSVEASASEGELCKLTLVKRLPDD